MTKPEDDNGAARTGTRPVAELSAGSFHPGDLLAGRYEIRRFVAEGGMGEVYEAYDRELREAVALKTVRPAISHDVRTIERFKREIQLARKVTHPNVCRIFDVGYHEGTPFLTMELLHGETLSTRLKRAGRMRLAEAFPLLKQMAAALDAAHESGVVHRDFKSSNVMLLPARPDAGAERVVVTDFGLARERIGEIEVASGAVASGRKHLVAVERDASEQGFLTIARRAAAARK